ncbi:alpha-1,2-fucosyltransferase [Parapedobacter tibetensis]|uniref:alpha-1,2-fucosyltransferase n=1 Tax=Parapedobacter tibetensis TaxID=2972951 RepID=UPI00214DC855|nr:alpha-1,2-fucosyltransferase [Parapedobacter tibetensis]
MKIVKFLGGLGNQLFQYAFFCALQQRFRKIKADFSGFDAYELHNGYELERIFGVLLPQASPFEQKLFDQQDRRWVQRKLRRLFGTKDGYYEEPVLFRYDDTLLDDSRNRYYWGYWQHINYINPVEDQLRLELAFPAFADQRNMELSEKLSMMNAVSVHVRRGDYLNDPVLGGICDVGYYRRALAYMEQHIADSHFVFFSNDIPWCRETFSMQNAIFVDWNTGLQSFRDMQLMSFCKHHIIANSSFSWWGAWLNQYAGKIVVSPDRWVGMEGLDLSGIILPEFQQINLLNPGSKW